MESELVDAQYDWSFIHDSVSLHSHSFYEIIYVIDGENIRYLLGASCIDLRAGDVLMIPPGTSHRPLRLDRLTRPYERFVLWISARMEQSLLEMFPDANLLPSEAALLRVDNETSAMLYGLFKKITSISYRYDDTTSCPLVVGDAIELLAQMCRARRSASFAISGAQSRAIEGIFAYIEAHFSEAISAKDAASYLHVSEGALAKALRTEGAASFHRLLNQRRLIEAKRLMLAGEDCNRAALNVGFTEYSTFFRAFKREYGISPTEYVRLNGETRERR